MPANGKRKTLAKKTIKNFLFMLMEPFRHPGHGVPHGEHDNKMTGVDASLKIAPLLPAGVIGLC